MIRTFLFFIALACTTACAAQEIKMYKTFGGVRFEYDTLTVSARQVSEILSIDPQAAAEFKVARTNSNVASVFGFTGGILLAFPIGTAIAGGEPEWGLAAGGAALILASIPFSRAFYRRAGSAIDNYNSRHGVSGRLKPQLEWRGSRLSLNFKF